jgi:hypothetical protein
MRVDTSVLLHWRTNANEARGVNHKTPVCLSTEEYGLSDSTYGLNEGGAWFESLMGNSRD